MIISCVKMFSLFSSPPPTSTRHTHTLHPLNASPARREDGIGMGTDWDGVRLGWGQTGTGSDWDGDRLGWGQNGIGDRLGWGQNGIGDRLG